MVLAMGGWIWNMARYSALGKEGFYYGGLG